MSEEKKYKITITEYTEGWSWHVREEPPPSGPIESGTTGYGAISEKGARALAEQEVENFRRRARIEARCKPGYSYVV